MQLSSAKLDEFDDAILFVGSMLSADFETNLPNGMAVSNEIISQLVSRVFVNPPKRFGITTSQVRNIERLARESPFEVVLQDYPDPTFARCVLAKTYASGDSNRFHLAISEAVKDKRISHVITTNYDLCLEKALGTKDVIVKKGDSFGLDFGPNSAGVVFKIHGCAARQETLVYRLSEEGLLPFWKRRLLRRMVEGRDLVVIGYSGRDFDICPLLFNLPYKRLFWLFPDHTTIEKALIGASQNLLHVHTQEAKFPKVLGVLGGFDKFFDPYLKADSILGKKPFSPSWSSGNICRELFEPAVQDPYSFGIWAASFFNSISCRYGVEAALESLSAVEREKTEALRLQSSADERAGLYRSSIKRLQQYRDSLSWGQDTADFLDSQFVEVGRRYTSGDFLGFCRARLRFGELVRIAKAENRPIDADMIEAQQVYLAALFRKSLGKIPLIGKLLKNRIRASMEVVQLESAIAARYKKAAWQDVQLLQTAAKDLGISVTLPRDVADKDNDILLSSVRGFTHLNNLVGRASAYRKSGEYVDVECEDLLDDLASYGHTGEFWKAFVAYAPYISKRHWDTYHSLCLAGFKACQYSFFCKTWLWVVLHFNLIKARYRRLNTSKEGKKGH